MIWRGKKDGIGKTKPKKSHGILPWLVIVFYSPRNRLGCATLALINIILILAGVRLP